MAGPDAGPGINPRLHDRLAYVVNGTWVVRYDNESGKGDHRHFNTRERSYTFETPEKLLADFQADMARWNRENRHS